MNAEDILKYGHQSLLQSLDGLSEAEAYTPGAMGVWSVREIVAHLVAYEQMLAELLGSMLGKIEAPTLYRYLQDFQHFNEAEVHMRRDRSLAELRAAYESAHESVMVSIAKIQPTVRRQQGLLTWFGSEYDLEDFLVYNCYGHKREHSAQIAVYRDYLLQTIGKALGLQV